MATDRGVLKGVLQNETVELETEMVVAIMKDVASALKYLHQLDPPSLAKDMTSSGVALNADYGAQLVHVHIRTVRYICGVSICCCSMMEVSWALSATAAVSTLVKMARLHNLHCQGSLSNPGRVVLPYLLKDFYNLAAFIKLLQAGSNHTYLSGLGWRSGRPTSYPRCSSCT